MNIKYQGLQQTRTYRMSRTFARISETFINVPNLVRWLIFGALIGVTDQFCWIRLNFNLRDEGQKKEKIARGVGMRGDYSRKAVTLNISVKGRLLFEGSN